MADKAKFKPSEGSNESSSGRIRSETKVQPPPDLTLGKAPLEKGERTGGPSRRFSVPVTQEEREATMKELNEIEPVERIPSILRTMPVRRETSPEDRPYALSRESVSPIGYPPEPLN